jgi:hypothetical protein
VDTLLVPLPSGASDEGRCNNCLLEKPSTTTILVNVTLPHAEKLTQFFCGTGAKASIAIFKMKNTKRKQFKPTSQVFFKLTPQDTIFML